MLAVRFFLEYYRQYLLGRKVIVRTDHQAVRYLFTIREPTGRVARWIEILSAYQLEIEYRPGSRHLNADALSRCTNPSDCQCSEVDTLEPLRCGPCKRCRERVEGKPNKPANSKNELLIRTAPSEEVIRRTRGEALCQGYTNREVQDMQAQDPDLSLVIG